jgi:hypothetical protein
MTRNRDYRHEYDSYHAKPEQKKKRAMRNSARSQMESAGRVSKGDGKEVDHKKPLRSGGSNSPTNLRVQPKSVNRAWRKGQ